MALLIAKYCYEQGMRNPYDIVKYLKEWAKRYNFFLTVSMINIAQRVINDRMTLCCAEVGVDDSEVEMIRSISKNSTQEKFALAILCYAKAYANSKGVFKISKSAFAHWLGFGDRIANMNPYFQFLIDTGYIKKHVLTNINSWYKKTVVSTLNEYIIVADYNKDDKQYTLHDNNIDQLYEEAFLGVSSEDDWLPIEVSNISDGYFVKREDNSKVKREQFVSENGKLFKAKILKPVIKSGEKYFNLKTINGLTKLVRADKLL